MGHEKRGTYGVLRLQVEPCNVRFALAATRLSQSLAVFSRQYRKVQACPGAMPLNTSVNTTLPWLSFVGMTACAMEYLQVMHAL